jgi:hypothetical protein
VRPAARVAVGHAALVERAGVGGDLGDCAAHEEPVGPLSLAVEVAAEHGDQLGAVGHPIADQAAPGAWVPLQRERRSGAVRDRARGEEAARPGEGEAADQAGVLSEQEVVLEEEGAAALALEQVEAAPAPFDDDLRGGGGQAPQPEQAEGDGDERA